jgi:hypothetical protein
MDEKERMQPLFSTRDGHPRERFDYWHEVARKNIVYHDDVQPDNRFEISNMSATDGGVNSKLSVFVAPYPGLPDKESQDIHAAQR